MDVGRFKVSDWMMIAGAALMLAMGSFLPWVEVSSPRGSVRVGFAEFFLTGVVPWILVIAVGVLAFLVAAGLVNKPPTRWSLVFVAASGLAMGLVSIRLVVPGLGVTDELDVARRAGLYVGFLAATIALAGAVIDRTATERREHPTRITVRSARPSAHRPPSG